MSFDEEWAGHKNRAAMRLNGTGGSGGDADLKTNHAGKAAAIKALSTEIEPDTGTAGIVADDSTGSAVTGFKGWATATGLKEALEEWGLQVKSLQARLANDRASLQQTKRNYLLNDHEVGSELSKIGGTGPLLQGPYAPGAQGSYLAGGQQSPPVYGPYVPNAD
ncbi:hypothetical protein ACFVZR_02685 [Streptomyces sp. NPDC058316]|uniref:hypothetical protein n=1 Tax=unclassified Streptomyces TaxID=2593676 RepID=UPI0036ECAC53